MMPPDTIRELLPAYALGILDDAERKQVESALNEHPDLQRELAGYNGALDDLLMALPQTAPPPDLGSRINQRVATSVQDTIRMDDIPKLRRAQPANRIPALAAAAILVVLLGAVLWFANRETEPDDPIAAILENENAQTIDLTGEGDFEDVRGAFVIDRDQNKAVLTLQNLDVLPQDQAYQLWLVRGEDDRDSGLVFRPETSDAVYLVELPGDFAGYQAIGITVEPDGGSEGPTGPAVTRAVLSE